MVTIQVDNSIRILCVNGERFAHHPAKVRSFHHKVFLNEHFLNIFQYLSKPRKYDEIIQYIAKNIPLGQCTAEVILQYLLDNGLLRQVNDFFNETNSWQVYHWKEALQFHSHTNNLPKMMYNTKQGEGEDIALMEEYVSEKEVPSNYKIVEGIQIPLEKPTFSSNPKLSNLFCQKQGDALDKSMLARLLYYAFGEVGKRHMRVTGQHVRKTVPSGGARHPIEAYLIIKDVPDIDAGIYHYNVKDHALTSCLSLSSESAHQVIREKILLDDNRPGFDFSLAILYSCVFARSMFRYRESRSYRVMHYDMGHLTQNLTFLAKGYGLNLYCGYSCHEKPLEKMIGLDSYMESIIAYSVL